MLHFRVVPTDSPDINHPGDPRHESDRTTAWNTRILGRSGMAVSELCLGAMMFGGYGQHRSRRVRRDHPPRARRRHQLHRHRRRLLEGRVGGDRRQGAAGPPRRGRDRDQVLQRDGRRPEPPRRLPALDHARGAKTVFAASAPTPSTCTRCTVPTRAPTSTRRSARSTISSTRARCAASARRRSPPRRSSKRSGRRRGVRRSASCASSRRTRSSPARSSTRCSRPASATAWA